MADKINWKLYFIIVGSVTVLALVVTIIVLTVSSGGNPIRDNNYTAGEYISSVKLSLDDFILPEEVLGEQYSLWYPHWDKKRKWTKEDIEPYWVNPGEIGVDILSKKNYELLQSILDPAP